MSINDLVNLSLKPRKYTKPSRAKVGLTAAFLGLLMMVPGVILGVYEFVASVRWEQNVAGHLKRAADANTVELALQEIRTANKYLADHGIKEGTTGVIYSTPHEDVGFWVQNLQMCEFELTIACAKDGETIGFSKVKGATQAEKDMVLLKLRQTLLDHTNAKGEAVTQPHNIYLYPHNTLFFVLDWTLYPLILLGLCVSFFSLLYGFSN